MFAPVVNALIIILAALIMPGFNFRGCDSAFPGTTVMAVTGMTSIMAMLIFTGNEINRYSQENYSALHQQPPDYWLLAAL